MFKNSCFIRKNNDILLKKLKEFGYVDSEFYKEGNCIITTSFGTYTFINENMYDEINPHFSWKCDGRIDCGKDENLFLKLIKE